MPEESLTTDQKIDLLFKKFQALEEKEANSKNPEIAELLAQLVKGKDRPQGNLRAALVRKERTERMKGSTVNSKESAIKQSKMLSVGNTKQQKTLKNIIIFLCENI